MAHEQIWAPWRMEYILGEKGLPELDDASELLPGAQTDCFICLCVAAGDDRKRLVVHRGEHTITIMNLFPYTNGHLLVAPQHHHARLDELGDEVHLEMSLTLARMVGLLERVLKPHGFNIGLNLGRSAGAGLPGHLHWHIVPRWEGDTSFMTSTAGVRVIPQSLDALWQLLARELAKG